MQYLRKYHRWISDLNGFNVELEFVWIRDDEKHLENSKRNWPEHLFHLKMSIRTFGGGIKARDEVSRISHGGDRQCGKGSRRNHNPGPRIPGGRAPKVERNQRD